MAHSFPVGQSASIFLTNDLVSINKQAQRASELCSFYSYKIMLTCPFYIPATYITHPYKVMEVLKTSDPPPFYSGHLLQLLCKAWLFKG